MYNHVLFFIGKLSILLLPCNSEQDKADLQTSLIQRHALVGIGDVSIVTVANDKPITRKQHEEASSFWPTNFHEDKRCISTPYNAELYCSKIQFILLG